MSDETISDLARRLVVGRKRDGRSVYDAQAKRELILACRAPGVSMARLARECGINANQLSAWVRQYERAASRGVVQMQAPSFVEVSINAAPPASAPAMNVQARLPNGVVIDLRGCDAQQASNLIEVLGRL
jgi:transposase